MTEEKKPTKNIVKIKWGRPSKFSLEIIKQAQEYINECAENDATPFVEELALRLGVWDGTLWRWSEKHKKFRRVYHRLLNFQKLDLKKKALSGIYLSKVATLLLSAEHGVIPTYKRELTGAGGQPIVIQTKFTPAQEKAIAEGIANI